MSPPELLLDHLSSLRRLGCDFPTAWRQVTHEALRWSCAPEEWADVWEVQEDAWRAAYGDLDVSRAAHEMNLA